LWNSSSSLSSPRFLQCRLPPSMRPRSPRKNARANLPLRFFLQVLSQSAPQPLFHHVPFKRRSTTIHSSSFPHHSDTHSNDFDERPLMPLLPIHFPAAVQARDRARIIVTRYPKDILSDPPRVAGAMPVCYAELCPNSVPSNGPSRRPCLLLFAFFPKEQVCQGCLTCFKLVPAGPA